MYQLRFITTISVSLLSVYFQVDGDTDTAPVQDDFKQVVREHIDYLKNSHNSLPPVQNGHTESTIVEDLDGIETVSKRVGNGIANGVNHMANGLAHMGNGYGPLKAPPLAQTLQRNSELNFMDGHI